MAFPTSVNNQITDSVTQANLKNLGDSPAIATSNLFIATSQALANAAHSATSHLAQTWVTAQAATTQGVSTLYTVDTASAGTASRHIERVRA
ncbi:MAG: RebB family R body protein [Acidobacteriota bacterium]